MKTLILFFVLISSVIYAQPPSIVNPTPFSVCDANNDGFESFNLVSKNTEILGSLNPLQFAVSYHASMAGSFLNNNVLSSPFVNTIPNSRLVYVRVQRNSNPNSFSTSTLELIANGVSINNNLQAYSIYENPYDGFANFDLTSRNELVSSNSNHEIIYFTTQMDAVNMTNSIVNPTAFVGSNLQIIWFRVTDTATNCFTTGSYVLKVFDSSVVIEIPDPKFKARLLAASPTELIAMSTFNNWITLDAINDGEIQFTEALEVTYFRLSGFNVPDSEKINSIEGINAFTNLIQLDCTSNFLTDINIDFLTNLKILECSGNTMTTLSLQNFQNLERIECGGGPLSNLNLGSIPNLQYLVCGYSMLTSLDVTQFTNLIELECRNSQLTSLNVQSLTNLVGIFCPFNQLTTLNLEGLAAFNKFSRYILSF
jgi:Leucine-rich repeat (LRR) protein